MSDYFLIVHELFNLFIIVFRHLVNIKVIEGERGLFIAMPSRKTQDGEYRDIAHPIDSETRERIQRIILERYEEEAAKEPESAEF